MNIISIIITLITNYTLITRLNIKSLIKMTKRKVISNRNGTNNNKRNGGNKTKKLKSNPIDVDNSDIGNGNDDNNEVTNDNMMNIESSSSSSSSSSCNNNNNNNTITNNDNTNDSLSSSEINIAEATYEILNNTRIKTVLDSFLTAQKYANDSINDGNNNSNKLIKTTIVKKCQSIDLHKGNAISIKGGVGPYGELIDLSDTNDIHFLGQKMNEYFTKTSDLNITQCKVDTSGIKVLMGYDSIRYIQTLNLQGNNITSTGLPFITQSLHKMPLLNHLDLHGNRLLGIYVSQNKVYGNLNLTAFTEFMDAVSNSSIKTLDVSYNYLGGLPSIINNRLLQLNEELYNTYQYDDLIINSIASMLHASSSLESLRLHSNDIQDNEILVQSLLDAIGNKNINLLDGVADTDENNSLNMIVKNLCPFYANLLGHQIVNKQIESLDLSDNNNINDDSILSIFRKVTAEKPLVLKKLQLNRTQITIDGVKRMFDLIDSDILIIQNLDFAENENFDDLVIKEIALRLKFNNKMKSLSIANCHVSVLGARYIADALTFNKNLTSLNISDNDIQITGLKRILDVLSVNCTLKSLIADENSFEDKAAILRTPAAWGLNKTGLTEFSIRGNPICGRRNAHTFDPACIVALAECLEISNSKMEKLLLSGCDIGARSTKRIFEMLKINNVIHTLEISGCNINEQGGIHVGEILPEVKALRILLMRNCLIGPYGAERLLLGLADNTSIEHVDLSFNYIMGYNTNEYLLNSLLAMQSVMKKNKTLKYIDLTENNLFGISPIPVENEDFHSIGALTLLEAISHCSHPMVLNIMDRFLPRKVEKYMAAPSYECPSSDAAANFINALKSNTNIKSLCGIFPTDKVVNLANRAFLDSHSVRIFAFELSRNQQIHTLKATSKYIDETMVYWLGNAIAQSISLESVEFPRHIPLENSFNPSPSHIEKIIKHLTMDENSRMTSSIEKSKRKSLDLRLTLCLFAKKFSLKNVQVRIILEYAFGDVDAIDVLIKRYCLV